ncbi:MAG: glycoside hydrolase family 3 [Chloroflexi bacterium]|nr:glycoside hydrolase family 3 [Chloroflexota bacterium]
MTAIVAACAPAGGSLAPSQLSTALSPEASLVPSTGPTAAPSSAPSASAAGLRSKIGRLLVVGFRGTALPEGSLIRRAIEAGELGGVILFDRDHLTGTAGRNITSPSQLSALTDAIRSAALTGPLGGNVIVAVDQEGGKIARLNPSDGYPATETEAALGAANDLNHTTDAATLMAITLAGAGIDLNLAPVVDLNVNPANPAIGALGRSFSADPAVVVAQASAVIDAHHAAGIKCAIKHFPGEGSATANTDDGTVDVTRSWTRAELQPFRELVAARAPDAVMVGHIVNGQLDPQHPASLSRATVTGLLRSDIGWIGPVISDDMQAPAISRAFGTDEAIALALEAGVDLLLFANQQVHDEAIGTHAITVIEGLVGSGRISEARIDESISRIEGLFAPTE